MFAAFNSFLVGSFNPLSLSPAVWLSDTGSDVATWSDLSGNGRNVTQATAGNQPSIVTAVLNGRQVRRFDGTADLMASASVTFNPRTIISVQVSTVSVGQQTIFNFPNAKFTIHRYSTSNILSYHYNTGGATEMQAITALTPTVANITSSVFENSTVRQFVNGATGSTDTGTWAAGTAGVFQVGGVSGFSEYFVGDIAEILVFPTALSTADRRMVERYLGAKYGVSVV